MTSLFNSILVGFSNFPFFAILFTLPIFLGQYIHYKKINLVRVGVCYGSLLYFLCFFALVFLPLPTISEAQNLSTHTIQFVPFRFVADIVKESPLKLNDIHTYLPALLNKAVLQVIFNIWLVIPFGMVLRYYFNFETKKVVLLSFGLSLFVEIAQLTGLFFVYNGSYRLCDVDDLMANTLGGFAGCQIMKKIEGMLPEIEKFDALFQKEEKAVQKITTAKVK